MIFLGSNWLTVELKFNALIFQSLVLIKTTQFRRNRLSVLKSYLIYTTLFFTKVKLFKISAWFIDLRTNQVHWEFFSFSHKVRKYDFYMWDLRFCTLFRTSWWLIQNLYLVFINCLNFAKGLKVENRASYTCSFDSN